MGGAFAAGPPNAMAMCGIEAGIFSASMQLASTSVTAIAATTRISTCDIQWTSGNASPAVAGPDSAGALFGLASFDVSFVPISRDKLSTDGGTSYRTRTAVVPEIDLANDADQEPSVSSDMGQVEREASAEPTMPSESQAAAFLDIAAPDTALQSPRALAGAARGIVVSREELALDRVMGRTCVFGLDSAAAIPVVAQAEAVARGETAEAACPLATTRSAAATEVSAGGSHHSTSASWQYRAAGGVAVMLFAGEQLFSGKRRKEDNDERPSRRSV